MGKFKIIRSATVPLSLKTFLNGSVESLMNKYDLVLLSSPGKELDDLHNKYGVRTIGIHMERRISLIKDIRSLWKLIRIFREEKPHMVHSMTPKAGLLCMLAAKLTGVPKRVHTFTGLVWPTATGIRKKILMLTDKILCACATNIIPEGEGVKNDLQTHITNRPMRVLGYGNVRGVDMNYWRMTEQIIARSVELQKELELVNTFTFVFIGRLVGDKGINELVEAFCQLYKYNQNVRLLLIGPTEEDLDPINSETWDKINNNSSIIEVGPVWGDALLSYYALSDCFVFPSYREGFPNTVLEAGAMGLPSIVTDINGSREIIIDGQNGLIVPPKDISALYIAMGRMVNDANMYQRMSSNARIMVETRFEQGFVRQCLLEYYDEIM